MKGSPAKLGTMQGTSGHSSALKQMETLKKYVKATLPYKAYKEAKNLIKGGNNEVKTSVTPKKNVKGSVTPPKKKGTDWAAMHKTAGGKDPRYKKMSQAEYKTEALRQSKAYKKSGGTIKDGKATGGKWDTKGTKVVKKVVADDNKKVVTDDNKKVVTSNVVKTDDTKKKTDTYGTKTEAEQNLDVRMAKRGRKATKGSAKKDVKTARANYGKGSEEVKSAKKVRGATKRTERAKVLKAKQEDYRDDRGIFAGLKRSINRGRLKRTTKRSENKGDVETLATKKDKEV